MTAGYAMQCGKCGGGVTHDQVAEWVAPQVGSHRDKKKRETEVGWPRQWTSEEAWRTWKWYWVCTLPVWLDDGSSRDCGSRCRSETEFAEHVYSQHVGDWLEWDICVHDDCYETPTAPD